MLKDKEPKFSLILKKMFEVYLGCAGSTRQGPMHFKTEERREMSLSRYREKQNGPKGNPSADTRIFALKNQDDLLR